MGWPIDTFLRRYFGPPSPHINRPADLGTEAYVLMGSNFKEWCIRISEAMRKLMLQRPSESMHAYARTYTASSQGSATESTDWRIVYGKSPQV